MHASKRQAITEPVCSEMPDIRRPEETTGLSREAKLIKHLKQIADEGDFVELCF